MAGISLFGYRTLVFGSAPTRQPSPAPCTEQKEPSFSTKALFSFTSVRKPGTNFRTAKPQYYYRLGLWSETPAVALVTARRSDARSQGVTVGTKIPQQNKKRRFPGWVQPGKASFLRKQPICFQFHRMQQLGRIDLLAVEITARADVQIIPPCKVKVV